MREIVFTSKNQFNNLISFIKDDEINETSVVALCKKSSQKNHIRLIVQELLIPEQSDLLNRSETRVSLSPDYMEKVYDKCVNEDLHPIDIHDHPFSKSKVSFSSVDHNQQDDVGSYINKYFNGLEFSFMVIGQDQYNIDASIWNRKKRVIESIDKIKIIDKDRLQLLVPHSSALSTIAPDNVSHRTMLAIGEETQNTISCLTIVIVGAGGLGAVLAEHFARLGVRKIIIIDDDIITETNLNRLIGATPQDVKNKVKKVYLCKRLIKKINRDIEVIAIDGDFLTANVQDICKEADIGIGAVDNVGARFAKNRLFQAHAIPYFDAGCGGKAENDKLTYAGGQVLKITPGGNFCLECEPFFSKEKARIDLMSKNEQKAQSSLGYIDGMVLPQASVYSWNSATISNLVWLVMRYVSGDCPRVDGIANDFLIFKSWSWREDIDEGGNSKEPKKCSVCHKDGYFGKGDEVPYLLRQKENSKTDNIPYPASCTDNKTKHLSEIVETLNNEVNRKMSLPLKDQFKENISLPEQIIRTFMYGKNSYEIELAMKSLTSKNNLEVFRGKRSNKKNKRCK